MKTIYSFVELENEVCVNEDGSIDVSLSDCAGTGLTTTFDNTVGKKIYDALKGVFEQSGHQNSSN